MMIGRKEPDLYKTEEWQDLQLYRTGAPKNRAPVGQLSPQPWLHSPETLAVLRALQADDQQVRFVGGCVRDALCQRPCHDIDIATPDPPETVIALLERGGLKVIPTGLKHGTVTAVSNGVPYEITTLRRDVETDGRHASVTWTSDWMADAARRDFTINALSASPGGAVYDYFDGMQDLAHGRVRFIGRAMDRIGEDALRILRFFRFHGRFGRGRPYRDGLEACRSQVKMLLQLSGERISAELMRILAASSATEMILEMQGVQVLETILPELHDIGRLRQMVFLETRGVRMPGLESDPLRRLGALMDQDGSKAADVARRLRLSNSHGDRLVAMCGEDGPSPTLSDAEFRRLLQDQGAQVVIDRMLLRWARRRSLDGHTRSRESSAYIARLEQAFSWTPQEFPVQGRDVLAMGVAPGPHVGTLLEMARHWWEEHDYQPDRSALLDYLRDISAAGASGGQDREATR